MYKTIFMYNYINISHMKRRSFILLPDSRIDKDKLYQEVASFIVTYPNKRKEFVEVFKINTPKLSEMHDVIKVILKNSLDLPLSPENVTLASKMGLLNNLLYVLPIGGQVPQLVEETFHKQSIDYPSNALYYLPYTEEMWKHYVELSTMALSRKRK